jgi:hypothetical protein
LMTSRREVIKFFLGEGLTELDFLAAILFLLMWR